MDKWDRTVIIISKYTLFFHFDIEKPVFLGKALENFPHILVASPYLVTDFNKETLLIVEPENFKADVLQQHEDSEMVFDAETK
jgi:hypothetical protein